MRISNQRLAVERGRYYKIPRNERLCKFYKTHQIFQAEDEMHILLSCLKHEVSRKNLFDFVKGKCNNCDELQEEDPFNYYLLNSDGSRLLSERWQDFI